MTEPDIIRIDGVECEICVDEVNVDNIKTAAHRGDVFYVPLRPKRVQTGVIKYYDTHTMIALTTNRQVLDEMEEHGWKPFHGKVDYGEPR